MIDDLFAQIESGCRILAELAARGISAQQLPIEFSKGNSATPEVRILTLETFFARQKVKRYLPALANGFFTKRGLEQRTHPRIAEYHAHLFPVVDSILEVGCGLGFDSAALSKRCKKLTTLEIDPVHAAFARKNFELQKISNIEVIEQGYEEYAAHHAVDSFDAIFADPARRSAQAGRTKNAEQFSPPLSSLCSLTNNFVVIKINPTNCDDIPGWSNQWIGSEGECKEKLLLKGILHPAPVVLVDTAGMIFSVSPTSGEHRTNQAVELPAAPFILAEPHPALSAAGIATAALPSAVFQSLPSPNLLSVSRAEELPLLTAELHEAFRFFHIFRCEPFKLKNLTSIIKELAWDVRTELKKANFNEEPESFRSQLNLLPVTDSSTDLFGVVFFTRFKEKKIMCFGKRI